MAPAAGALETDLGAGLEAGLAAGLATGFGAAGFSVEEGRPPLSISNGIGAGSSPSSSDTTSSSSEQDGAMSSAMTANVDEERCPLFELRTFRWAAQRLAISQWQCARLGCKRTHAPQGRVVWRTQTPSASTRKYTNPKPHAVCAYLSSGLRARHCARRPVNRAPRLCSLRSAPL